MSSPDFKTRPEGFHDRALIRLALQTGLRVSEFTGLDVGLVWGPEGPRQRLFCRLSASSDQLANLTVLYGAGSYAR